MQRREKSEVEKLGKCLYDSFCLVLYYYIEYAGRCALAFATSGGSGIGKTAEKLKPYLKGAETVDARLVHTDREVADWVRPDVDGV